MIIYNVHPVNPQRRYLDSTARILRDEGGIAVYLPTPFTELERASAIPKLLTR